jgi:hypothetical protein
MRIPALIPYVVEQHPEWHLCGIGLFILLAAFDRRAGSSGVFVLSLWNLSGVMLHELAHLFVGLIFRAQPTGISLIPRRAGKCWNLGSVSFNRITAFNAMPVALAPLGLVAMAYWIAINWFSWHAPSFSTTLLLYALLFILLYNALPSRQDLRVAFNWKSILLYLPLAATLAVYFTWQIP